MIARGRQRRSGAAVVARARLEAFALELGEVIGKRLPRNVGFSLSIFTFGEQPSYVAWISNAERDDLVRVLREQARRLETGFANTKGDA